MIAASLLQVVMLSRAAGTTLYVRTRPIAGGLGDNGLPDPPGN